MARKRRHVKILEKLHKGDAPTKSEIKELADYEGGEPDPGIVDNQDQVAHVFGVSVRTVANWVKDGMPVMKDGKYDIAEIQAWRFLKKGGNKKASKTSKNGENWDSKYREYKARFEEIRLKQALGELVSKREVETGLIQISIAIKRALLSLPRSVAPRLMGLEPREIEKVLRQSVEDIINLFAQDKIFGDVKTEKKKKKHVKSRKKAKHLDR